MFCSFKIVRAFGIPDECNYRFRFVLRKWDFLNFSFGGSVIFLKREVIFWYLDIFVNVFNLKRHEVVSIVKFTDA